MTVRNRVAWQDEGSKQGVTEEGMAQGGVPGRTATSAGNSVELLHLHRGPNLLHCTTSRLHRVVRSHTCVV
jgi:hypothetical protein